MMAPGLEVMAGQHPPHGGGGDTLNDPRRDEPVCQFRAIPLGQDAAQRIRALAGQPHDVDRDLRGKIALGTAARGVREAIQALGEKPLGPLADDGPLHTN